MKGCFLVIALFSILHLSPFHSIAQIDVHWEKVGEIPVNNPHTLSLDGRDQLFVADVGGNINQFSKDGDSINFYSPVLRSSIQELEAAWTVSILAFSADMQQAEILDRFLNPISHIKFSQEGFGMISQANLGNGNVLWLIEEAGLKLFKFDYRRKQILQEQPLSLLLPGEHLIVLQLLERKNTLFLLIEDLGVFILDNQANPIKHLPGIPNSTIYIKGDLIYSLHEGKLLVWDFIKNSSKEVKLPKATYQKLAVSDDLMFFMHKGGIDIFEKPHMP